MHPSNGTDTSAHTCDICRASIIPQQPHETYGIPHLAQRLERLEALTLQRLSPPPVAAPPLPTPAPAEAAPPPAAQPIWSGRPALASYAPGVLTTAGWAVVWTYVVFQSQEMAWYGTQLLGLLREWLASGSLPVESFLWPSGLDWLATASLTPLVVQVVGGFLALCAVWSFQRRVRYAVGTAYHLSTHALQLRTGPLAGQQIELALQHLAHFRLRQSLRGRLWGYARCRFVSSQPGARAMVWRGVPLRPLTTALLQTAAHAAQETPAVRR